MVDFSTLTEHPDKEEIISKIVNGSDAREINQWLKLKYPLKEQKHLVLSIKLLQEFSKSQYNDYYQQYTQQITTAVQSGQPLEKKISDSLLNNKTFKERLSEHAEKEINVRDRFLMVDLLIRTRVEQLFDKIQENPNLNKQDYVMLKYCEQWLNMLDKYDKSQNNRPDQIIQHNYTVQYMNQTSIAIQDGLREALSELDPEVALLVMSKISEKLESIVPPPELAATVVNQSPDQKLSDILKLEAAIKDENA